MDTILTALDSQFVLIDGRSRQLLALLTDQILYERPTGTAASIEPLSCGEFIARSAAEVERTFGGLTTRLWDDPYEWTLPEKLSSIASLLTYLDEVEATRSRGFLFFVSDTDLKREIPAPVTLRPIIDVLLDTLARSAHFQGRAFETYRSVTSQKPPRL
ncbi:MAG: hypothetical protein KBD94_00105 [Pyrinomonadaceae bacterium]|nr:hypothetical protein [Pyrinomonadaceae bacterium]